MRTILIFFLAAFMAGQACTSTKTASARGQEKQNQGSDSLFFSIERTPCYGKCPVYKVHIYQSGYATFEAIRNAGDKEGFYRAVFSEEEMKLIGDKAMEINYFNMADEYDSEVTDLPSVITSLTVGKKYKRIMNRHKGPAELRQFEKFADEVIGSKGWEKIIR